MGLGRHLQRPRRFLVFLVVIAIVAAALPVVRVAYDLFECSSPSQATLDAQRDFVMRHIAARNVQTGTYDCDNNGAGFVSFTSELAPADVQATFLRDRVCKSAADELTVRCKSSGETVYISFRELDGTPTLTSGELSVD
ncbi:hypothetical protein FHX74_001662 [Friedmanniella endophytica]|uniref:Uncharacterized protein n=1 Tax=Microlunatus kandeliicorticis TaxID=1759536 RepID=A0A7W3IRT6_9ACTN|nr:hypothetical protein [Microlunatus kandeliicorticis]MBA8794057.1 hypothetical protein [Microlunatus kandeliicorticis]